MTLVATPPLLVRRAVARVRRRRRLLALAVLLLLPTLWLALSWTSTDEPGPAFNRGENAIWIGHTWVEDAHSEDEIAALAAKLTAHQIRYVFAHVGPLDADGTIPPERAPRATAFATTFKRYAPRLLLLAWIGQVEARGGGILNLDDLATRRQVVATAARFATMPGWDGVHYDIEPLFDADARFLALLDETRPALNGRLLSVATPRWFPGRYWSWASRRMHAAIWSGAYYATVAGRTDQLAVMLYDSGLPSDRTYSLLVKQQTTNILWAVRATRVQVLFGVPVYHGNSPGFRDYAENMTSGLRGITLGLNNTPPVGRARFGGIAIYPEWETSDDDWAIFDREWRGQPAR